MLLARPRAGGRRRTAATHIAARLSCGREPLIALGDRSSGLPMWAFWLTLVITPLGGRPPALGQAQIKSRPPNIVLILVDDLGATDLQYTGSDYHLTPVIDRLAAEGMRFTQAYAAAPVCSPTRAAILTGRFPARLDMTTWHEASVSGGPRDRPLRDAVSRENLPHDTVTLAEHVSAQSYLTAHVGKWHLGTAAHYPETHGFDLNIGGTFWGAPATFFAPFRGPWSSADPEMRYVPGLGISQPEDYLTDRLTDEALTLLEQAGDRPILLNLWYYAVHSPLEAPESAIERCRARPMGKYHRNPTYAAMVERVDQNVGRVLEKLDQLKQRNNTIVIFTSDNGGVDIPVRSGTPTSNHPFRSGKGTLYEGGLRVPLIIRWPGHTRPGSQSDQPVCSQDLFATILDALSHRDRDAPGTSEHIEDGYSLMPLLHDPAARLERQTIYWHFPHYYTRMSPASALRHADWKLIHYYERDRLELYQLGDDPSEEHDVSAAQPEIARRLKDELDAWRQAVGANPPQS